ncbi:HD-GYP domain-containing protein [Thermanaerovibrio acidaminovorans]|uniref:HD-GYP domain-containing protein n=1 Tax=Thermanaerovibrio acidaminovorans TaxID=81462 RepID=UPI00248FFE44|nr:HD-GYP domain-containing protein [Thermanaerovibrio acidaminovorans]
MNLQTSTPELDQSPWGAWRQSDPFRRYPVMWLLDGNTRLHSIRVMGIAVRIGRAAGLEGPRLETLSTAALLHDVGKVKVPEGVLLKGGVLNDHEKAMIQRHPVHSAEILSSEGFDPEVVEAVRHHHERFDGRGYPDGLSGNRIPLLSRIIALADSFDAMTSHRPYRRAMGVSQPLGEIWHHRGDQFDPMLAELFVALFDERPLEGIPCDPHVPHRDLMHSVRVHREAC